jgi:cell division protein ZapA (FtsZ GTPase activity inhibitor)
MNRIKIEVLGSTYTIATPEEEEYVLALAKDLDGQLRQLLAHNPKMSPVMGLILCAINSADLQKKSEGSADHLRRQLTEYLEDVARTRIELDDARRELDRLKRQLDILRKADGAGRGGSAL